MRVVTAIALTALLLALVGAAAFGFLALQSESATVRERWISDTEVGILANHHAPAAGVVDGEPMVFAPISGAGDSDQCALVGLAASDGEQRWRHGIPPANCTLHAVADPTLADVTGDGTRDVVAATTEELVVAHDALDGDRTFRHSLEEYGYTRPVVANLTGDARPEIAVVDVDGNVLVVGPDGTEHWRDELGGLTWGQPAVADFDGDGANELAVAASNGIVRIYEGDGRTRVNGTPIGEASVLWMTTVPRSNGGGTDVVVASVDGTVARLSGTDGSIVWSRTIGRYAAVHAVGDGDGDGTREVYAVARDGLLRSLDATDGQTEWTTTLTTADVEMTPPPSIGDLDGDGAPELLTVTNDGIVAVVDPDTGEIRGRYSRSVPIFTHPTLADTDDDPALEPYVVYGDGRVVALEVG